MGKCVLLGGVFDIILKDCISGRIDMRIIRLFTFAVLAVALGGSTPASAGWVNELGRNLGLGWSDGYHAYEGCADPRLSSQPWQRRASRGGLYEEPLVPYLEPAPSPRHAPEPIPVPKTSRVTPLTREPAPARTSQLHISRPNY